ncbi:MAG: twin-arginine translocation signal domain-containing protein [Nanoarchaeota archaeon]
MAKSKKKIPSSNKLSRRNFITGALALLVAAGTGLYISNRTPSIPEELISHNARIEHVVNSHGDGNIYLIGMIHYAEKGTPYETEKDRLLKEATPKVQSEIFSLLYDLSQNKFANLIIGEGLGNIEVRGENSDLTDSGRASLINDLENPDSRLKFFKEFPTQPAYITLEAAFPEKARLFGVNDISLSREIFELSKKRDELFNSLRQDKPQYEKIAEPLEVRIRQLLDEKSLLTLRESEEIADRLNEKNLAIVVGQYHLDLIRTNYHGKRRLIQITPNSIP